MFNAIWHENMIDKAKNFYRDLRTMKIKLKMRKSMAKK